MSTLGYLIKRNISLFLKDKGLFFTSLITPIILIVLFISFLGNVYYSSIEALLPEGISVSQKVLDGTVSGWLFSSLLATSCVTISFCSNFIMVQDKTNNALNDMLITPVNKNILKVSYFISTVLVTLMICLLTLCVGFIYIGIKGFYLTFADCMKAILDVFLMVLFGTSLSSIINYFLSTQGQMSAVGTLVSSVYGFVCGAYMPISEFSIGIQNVVKCLPGTYGTSLIHNHLMSGAVDELAGELAQTIGQEGALQYADGIKFGFDISMKFNDQVVSEGLMYVILVCAIILLFGVYILLNTIKKRGKK